MSDPLVEHLWSELHDLEGRVSRQEDTTEQRLRRLEDRALAEDARTRSRQARTDWFLKRYPVLIWTVGMVVSVTSLALTFLHH